ncbi:flagellar basal body-associated FliL family protein [Janthinobacterium sp. PC23-8]|uniref:flagellar basal body-associated FliL family protein n=1 Tax=Janthinobacterium sp. PC23-8 TaxID=2012679 RepID=UPI000B96D9D1|nr:flagellar basal body-associated FliL family protein [Janthinobacterium sp. PC23-8]OYO29737.1 flagellar basal body protein [Janthinobacterium sp. PC23-8]
MNTKVKLIGGFLLVALLAAGAAGGAMWYLAKPVAGHAEVADAKAPPPPATGKKARKFVTLDKVIVMLRHGPGETDTHYLSADLVISTTEENEKTAKAHLPLMRSIAVSTLSSFSTDKAQAMTVEQYAAEINKAFNLSYEREQMEKPFSEVMVGKLIIE